MTEPQEKPAGSFLKMAHWHRILQITNLSYFSLFLLWSGLTFGFATAYFLLASLHAHHGPVVADGLALDDMNTAARFLNSLYYSVITATSTGYGDIVPHGFSKVLASMQSILSLFIFAIFVTKLVSHRQEVALQEVHKLTFEDIFHNTREDLFIVRKDFEQVIEEALQTKTVSQESWDELTTAYRQAQTLIAEIPDFYSGGNTFYTIDPKREELLLEAVQRTMRRINKMLDVLSTENIDWVGQEENISELRELMRTVQETTPLWRDRSPHQHMREAFEDILQMTDGTHARIEKAIEV